MPEWHPSRELSIGVAFLLGAPVINPVVIVSTFSAFGWGPILVGRLVFSFLIATITGWVFSRAEPAEALAPQVISTLRLPIPLFVDGLPNQVANSRFGDALRIAGDDFLDMSRYLIVGSMLAATMQTIVPQSALLAVGQGSQSLALSILGARRVVRRRRNVKNQEIGR